MEELPTCLVQVVPCELSGLDKSPGHARCIIDDRVAMLIHWMAHAAEVWPGKERVQVRDLMSSIVIQPRPQEHWP